MHDIWRLGKQWDNPLPNRFDATLRSLLTEIRNVSSIQLPRFLFREKTPTKESALHIFGDASITAICAEAYLRTEHTESICSINFNLGKAKVALIRQQSISKLEKTAAVFGVWLAHFINQQLDVTIGKTAQRQTAQRHYNGFKTLMKDIFLYFYYLNLYYSCRIS